MRVYSYGARMPTVNLDVVLEQMRLALDYYNKLIEIERRRKVEYEGVLLRDDAYAEVVRIANELHTRLMAVRDEINRLKQKAQADVATPVQVAEARKLKKERDKAYARKKKERKRVQELGWCKEAVAEINARAKTDGDEARHNSGLYWCTYNQIGQAFEAAKKFPEKLKKHRPKSKRTGADKFIDALEITAEKMARESYMPRFKRGDGSGHISVQIQYGLSVKEAFSCEDNRFQIVAPPENAWDSKHSRRKLTQTVARLRVGPKDNPVLAEIPFYMHRPLPKDGTINQIHLIRESLAGRSRWKLQLSVESSEKKEAPVGRGAIGIDIGWRQLEKDKTTGDYGLRVAYWCNNKDEHGEFALTQRHVGAFLHEDKLESDRDKNLNVLKDAFRDWKKAKPYIPDWLRAHLKTLHSWNAQVRFVRLTKEWERKRFEGDGLMFGVLAAWKKQDDHMWKYVSNHRDKSQKRRLDYYRVWAAALADKYSEVVLEADGDEDRAMDLRPLAEQADPEDPQDWAQKARRNRMIASVASLRTCVIQAFWARGRSVRWRDHAGTTERHVRCKFSEQRTAKIMQTCSKCDEEFDRDENAARNLVMAWSKGPEKHLGRRHEEKKLVGSRYTRRREQRETEKAEAQRQRAEN